MVLVWQDYVRDGLKDSSFIKRTGRTVAIRLSRVSLTHMEAAH